MKSQQVWTLPKPLYFLKNWHSPEVSSKSSKCPPEAPAETTERWGPLQTSAEISISRDCLKDLVDVTERPDSLKALAETHKCSDSSHAPAGILERLEYHRASAEVLEGPGSPEVTAGILNRIFTNIIFWRFPNVLNVKQ